MNKITKIFFIAIVLISSFAISANADNNPTVSCTVASPQIVGDSLTWNITLSDTMDPYSVSINGTVYDLNDNMISEWAEGEVTSVTKPTTQPSKHTAYVTLADGSGQIITANCPDAYAYGILTMTSCNPSVDTAVLGQNVSWNTSFSGGVAPYTFTWSGSDAISGYTSNTVSIAYSATGTKTASVEAITSADGQFWASTVNCANSVSVYDNTVEYDPIVASCSVSSTSINKDESVTWTANITGGLAPYTVDWSGSDDLTGGNVSITKKYSTDGTKTATFTTVVDSSGLIQTVSVSCPSVNVVAPSSGGGGVSYGSSGTPSVYATTTATTTVALATTTVATSTNTVASTTETVATSTNDVSSGLGITAGASSIEEQIVNELREQSLTDESVKDIASANVIENVETDTGLLATVYEAFGNNIYWVLAVIFTILLIVLIIVLIIKKKTEKKEENK